MPCFSKSNVLMLSLLDSFFDLFHFFTKLSIVSYPNNRLCLIVCLSFHEPTLQVAYYYPFPNFYRRIYYLIIIVAQVYVQ